MPQPKIHLVRHAQGFHNLGFEFHSLLDPKLTPLGQSQCAELQSTHFPPSVSKSISLVTASPLSRTLHTAYLVFGPALKNGKCQPKILAIPDAQETSDFPCDTGSEVEVLHGIVRDQNWPTDLSLVKEGWNVKTLQNRYSPAGDAIKRRARDARVLLREKARELHAAGDDAVEIVLVAHGAYMHYISNDWEDAAKFTSTGWENCEFRTYNFEADFLNDNADVDAFFVETTESRKRRGKNHPMISHERQVSLCDEMMQAWEDQGCQNPAKLNVLPSEAATQQQKKLEQEKHLDPEGQDPAPQGLSLERTNTEIEVMA
jgi:broad specificity phosphatase PhoE